MRRLLPFALLLSSCGFAQSGLLLGLRNDTDEGQPRYFTLWINPSGKQVTFHKFDGLIVPTGDGFWRVSAVDSCTLQNAQEALVEQVPDDASHVSINDQVTQSETLWFTPVSATPMVAGGKCEAVEHLAAKLVEQAKKKYPGKEPAPESFEDQLCESSTERLHFINGHYMAVQNNWSRTCWSVEDNRGWRVTGFNTSQDVDIAKVVGDAGVRAFKKSARQNLENEYCRPENENDIDTKTWLIHHENGRWQMKGGFFSSVIYCHGAGSEFDLSFAVPSWIAGREAPVADWKQLKRDLPGAADAIMSLDNKWIVVLEASGAAVKIYALETGRPVRLLGQAQASSGAQIVMQEWSLGANVARWDLSLKGIPPTVPVVKFDGRLKSGDQEKRDDPGPPPKSEK